MNARMKGMMVLLALLAGLAVGCQDPEKIDLQQKNAALQAQNDELRKQINESEQGAGQLAFELAQKKDELARRDLEIERLRNVKPPVPPTPPQPPIAGGGPSAPGWERGIHGDKVSVGSDILFASGMATLTSAGKTALDKVAADIKKSYAGLPVRVYGYTDSDPIAKTKSLWQDNLDLSANRAMAVTRYLSSKGIKPELIETIAMGPANPVSDNKTAAGKSKNRRVEILVLKTR